MSDIIVSSIWDVETAISLFGDDYNRVIFSDKDRFLETRIHEIMTKLAESLEVPVVETGGVFLFDDELTVEYVPGPWTKELDERYPGAEKWSSENGMAARSDIARIRSHFKLADDHVTR